MERLYRATLLVMYQLSLIAGIALLPVALLTRQVGFQLPIDRVIMGLKESYEQTR
jgi:hypothetical protein